MPPKKRELKAEPRKAGFRVEPGKGSHTNWRHPRLPGFRVTLSGHDGDDARHYEMEAVREALERLRAVERESP
jgi:predicted RNA binding protein YcfA (HicA-like mRNA interferase family)